MPLIKYAAMPTARTETLNAAVNYGDLAVLDFSTNGHGVYNFGNLTRLFPFPEAKNIFSTHITEVDIALGDVKRLKKAVKELAQNGYKNIFIMPSSLASVLGFDLESYAEEISAEFGVNAFTCAARLDDDCFIGAKEFLSKLTETFCVADKNAEKSGFNLLGGRYTVENAQNNAYLSELIEREIGLDLKFDSLNVKELSDWKKASTAAINVVSSKTALKAAEYMKKRFGVPYVYFYPLGKNDTDEGLNKIAAAIGKAYERKDDKQYAFAEIQARNVILQTGAPIVCYTDSDRLGALKRFFDGMGIGAEYLCSHAQNEFKFVEINDFIEKHSASEALVLSYDRVCKYMKKSVIIEKLGLDYKLITPLKHISVGIDGAYSLMEKIIDTLFKEQ